MTNSSCDCCDSFAGRRSDPLSLNLYTYCRNNPIRYVDPSGHSYATLPDGSKMSINSGWDANLYNKRCNEQFAVSSPQPIVTTTSSLTQSQVTITGTATQRSTTTTYTTVAGNNCNTFKSKSKNFTSLVQY